MCPPLSSMLSFDDTVSRSDFPQAAGIFVEIRTGLSSLHGLSILLFADTVRIHVVDFL